MVIPPNKPCIRVDRPWQPFRTDHTAAEERDLIIQQALTSRRPLLIGTSSTSASIQIYRSVLETVQRERAAMEAAVRRRRLLGALAIPSRELYCSVGRESGSVVSARVAADTANDIAPEQYELFNQV